MEVLSAALEHAMHARAQHGCQSSACACAPASPEARGDLCLVVTRAQAILDREMAEAKKARVSSQRGARQSQRLSKMYSNEYNSFAGLPDEVADIGVTVKVHGGARGLSRGQSDANIEYDVQYHRDVAQASAAAPLGTAGGASGSFTYGSERQKRPAGTLRRDSRFGGLCACSCCVFANTRCGR